MHEALTRSVSRRAEIGPKAESLRLLADGGLPVPEARYLDASDYREHAARAGVSSAGSAAAIRDAIAGTPLTAQVESILRTFFRDLGGGPLAVRSSANAEDLPGASFAGQHGTYFVATANELLARVRDCWASLYSDRAVSYRARMGLADADVAMAVIVQRLVPALAAGVAFTAAPLAGDDNIHIEACPGIGEALVSGRVSPDRFVMDRRSLEVLERAQGDKRLLVVVREDGHVATEPIGAKAATLPAIDDEVAREVARLALEAEGIFGVPVDVEWAYDGTRVWLLQARPITTQAPPTPGLPIIWSNVNTGEILPDVATPMTWSVIYDYSEQIFGGMFGALGIKLDAQELIGLVGGRVYFNLTLLSTSFRNTGIDFDRILGGMHDSDSIPPEAIPQIDPPGRMKAAVGHLRAGVSMPAYVWNHRASRAAPFLEVMRSTTAATARSLDTSRSARDTYSTLAESLKLFMGFADSLAFASVAMLGFGALTAVCNKWLDDEHGALANQLVTGRGSVASADAGLALWRLAVLAREDTIVLAALDGPEPWSEVRSGLLAPGPGQLSPGTIGFLEAWDDFMLDYGHHRRGEIEFYNPTWAERPDYILGIVRGYLERDGAEDPLVAIEQRTAQADTAARTARGRLANPLKRAIFDRVLVWGRASAGTRENMKSEAVRWLSTMRKVLLKLGDQLVAEGKLDERDDVFFLQRSELPDIVEGEKAADWRALIAQRRARYRHNVSLSPPSVVIGDWDERSRTAKPDTSVRTLTGISVSAGVVRGPARVFARVDTHDEVLPGEILVAPFTDPGWTPYFIPAAGIVMDMGGMLSHGSIIAREYGIPAVANVGPATHIIETGQLIEVDGDRGEVRILG